MKTTHMARKKGWLHISWNKNNNNAIKPCKTIFLREYKRTQYICVCVEKERGRERC